MKLNSNFQRENQATVSITERQNYLTDTVTGNAFHLDIPIQSIQVRKLF